MAHRFHILLIDDDEVDRMAIARALKAGDLEAQLTEVTGSSEGLELLRQQRFDCVLLDLRMPGKTGLEVLQEVQAAELDTPVIMLTGHGDEKVAVELMKAGAADYLSKADLSADGLARSLQHVIELHQARSNSRLLTKRLEEERARLQVTLDATATGTWDFNPVTGRATWDARCAALFGLKPDVTEVTYDVFLNALHPEDRERADAAVQAALRPDGPGQFDIEYRTIGVADQAVRWCRARGRALFDNGQAIRFIGTIQDVSANKASEAALRESQERHRIILELSPMTVWMADARGDVTYCNRHWTACTGIAAEQSLGTGWTRALRRQQRDRLVRLWRRFARTGSSFELELAFIEPKSRSYRWHIVRGQPLIADGQVTGWIGTAVNIDARKRAETERKHRAEFERQLIGIVSHDLRNPLNVISLAAGALAHFGPLTDSQKTAIGRILNSTTRASAMIGDLLDFTRARLGGGIPISAAKGDIHDVARHAVEEAQARHPTRAFRFISEGDGSGQWDSNRIHQVLDNLITNALKYGDGKGAVTVRSCGFADRVVIDVHNWGNPIAPELQASLFEPYRVGLQSDSTAKVSLGLGLFIVREIARAHGGHVHVESSAETGTWFVVQIPRAASLSPSSPVS